MPAGASHRSFKPRELRRRLLVPARMRDGVSWSDACIVNISSRGMMIRSSRPLPPGAEVEIRRSDHVIPARVVWRQGASAGLQAECFIPVEEIMTLGRAPALQLTAVGPERRKTARRDAERSRLRGRAIQFAGTVAISIVLTAAGVVLVEQAFARPLAIVTAALGV